MSDSIESLEEPIAETGYHWVWKVVAVAFTVGFWAVAVYVEFITQAELNTTEFLSEIFVVTAIPLAAYAVLNLRLRVYPDRIERERFKRKVISYDNTTQIHLSDHAPERVSIYEEGMSYYPAIQIHNGLADWREVAEALMEQAPDTIDVTGSDNLKEELRSGESAAP